MSLYELQQAGQRPRTSNPDHQAAEALNVDAAKVYDRARSNPDLSDAAKRRQIASAYLTTKQRMATLKANVDQRQTDRFAKLSKTAFGVPTDPIAAMSYRDALDRAQQIDTPAWASQQLTRALNTGDTLMAQAIGQHADDVGWSDVVDQYAASKPGVAEALAELSDIQAQQLSAQVSIFAALEYHVPTPPELTGLMDQQVEQIAAGG